MVMNQLPPDESLARLEALAKMMDGAFVIPGTNIRMGIDGIVGFIPGVGDMISGVVSSYLIWEARQLGAPKWLIARIVANTAIDTVIGAIPVAGDVFDIMFRANQKNMALLRGHVEKRGYRRDLGPIIDAQFERVR